jgi:hypothetical protein
LISKIGPGQLSERKKWHCEIRFFLPIQWWKYQSMEIHFTGHAYRSICSFA